MNFKTITSATSVVYQMDYFLYVSGKKTKGGKNINDKQMVALLRSQILTLRQENDQLRNSAQVGGLTQPGRMCWCIAVRRSCRLLAVVTSEAVSDGVCGLFVCTVIVCHCLLLGELFVIVFC